MIMNKEIKAVFEYDVVLPQGELPDDWHPPTEDIPDGWRIAHQTWRSVAASSGVVQWSISVEVEPWPRGTRGPA